MSRHTCGSRQDTHSTRVPHTEEGCGWLSSTHRHKESKPPQLTSTQWANICCLVIYFLRRSAFFFLWHPSSHGNPEQKKNFDTKNTRKRRAGCEVRVLRPWSDGQKRLRRRYHFGKCCRNKVKHPEVPRKESCWRGSLRPPSKNEEQSTQQLRKLSFGGFCSQPEVP